MYRTGVITLFRNTLERWDRYRLKKTFKQVSNFQTPGLYHISFLRYFVANLITRELQITNH